MLFSNAGPKKHLIKIKITHAL